MKLRLCLITMLCAMMASCNGNHNNYNKADTSVKPEDTALAKAPDAPVVNMEYCFYNTEGANAQDTTKVNLHINGDEVTGNMSWLPKEKDARMGIISGTLKGNEIKALWTYKQEGTTEKLNVEFQLRGDELAQKPYKYDKSTGRQLTDSGAGYSIIYNMKNCD